MKMVILHLITLFQELNNGIDLQSNRLYDTDKIKKRPIKAISHHTYIICFMENQLKCVF